MIKNRMIPLYIMLMLIAIYIFISPLFISGLADKNVLLKHDQQADFNMGFEYYNSKGEFVSSEKYEEAGVPKNEKFTLSKTLTDIEYENNYLGIRMLNNAVSVYIDGLLISECGYSRDGTYEKLPRSYWELFLLPSNLEGKVLTIEVMSPFEKYSGDIPDMKFGSKNSILSELANNNVGAFIASSLAFFMGIIILCIYFGMREINQENRSFLYLGYLGILISLWLMAESNYMQLFISNYSYISSDSYFFLILIPIPMVVLFENSYKVHHKNLAKYINWAFVIYAIASILLHMFNILYIFQTLVFFHMLGIIMIAYFTCSVMYESIKYKNKEAIASLIEICILFIFGILEIVSYYLADGLQTGSFLRIGLMVFLIRSIFTTIKKLRIGYEKSREALHFKEIAYVDILTGGKNRRAFERDLNRFSTPRRLDVNTWLVMLDANNLKDINDTKGHVIGDSYLEFIYSNTVSVFNGYGNVYRIGGDEFACILSNITQEIMEEKVLVLQKKVAGFLNEQKTGVAVGFALYEKDKGESLTEFIQHVDNKMYENKKIIK